MKRQIFAVIRGLILSVMLTCAAGQSAWANMPAGVVFRAWYQTILELVRHTSDYSPPVASRSFAYLGIIAYEAVASGSDSLVSLQGQLKGFEGVPHREAGQAYDDSVVVEAALAAAAQELFSHTGPTGQRAMKALEAKLFAAASEGLSADVIARSEEYGKNVAETVLAWSQSDGGANVENMGFPLTYKLKDGPSHWKPTSTIAVQQAPLLPDWGKNRTFAMPEGAACRLPPPPDYSEDPSSEFYKQAFEVYDTRNHLTADQKEIAWFWSDDPMLSPTPPGHWIGITLEFLDAEQADVERSAEVITRLSIALADAFIGCWDTKYEYDLLRPVTYIRKLIDPKWETLIITPPFPEYPSGHSTQTGAAAEALTAVFGDNFAFDDTTHERDGLGVRHFTSFHAAAQEAGISRLYGGIHFRAAIELGLDQGKCIGAYAAKLSMDK